MASNQKQIKELTDEILVVTMEIKGKFPELYQFLDETPSFSSINNKGIEPGNLEEYLNTIRSQLRDYKKGTKSNSPVD